MRVLTYNVNGIRAAMRKGLLDWLATDPADVICLQEIKAQEAEIDCEAIRALGYHCYFLPAQRKGYSGVGLLSRVEPEHIHFGGRRGAEDLEGRVIRADYGDVSLFSAYFPNGGSGPERQAFKYQWLDEFLDELNALHAAGRRLIVCGDYNIAHREIDIHNPKANAQTSGFLPEERAWMDRFFDAGFADGFRCVNEEPHQYSWWSFRANARNNNKGWRIDYISVSEVLRNRIRHARMLPDIAHSDHCPVLVEFEHWAV